MEQQYDVITLGRVSMDLFSENIGAPFVEIESFETSVGGSPTNIAIGASRLGLRSVAITAVGHDKVGDFVLEYLANEKVETQFIPRKTEGKTGVAVLGIEPPNKFPLQFYRDNPADIYLTIDDIHHAPITASQTVLLSGTALSRGTCRDATLYASEVAARGETKVFMDLDLRPDQWNHPYAYGLTIRTILPNIDVLIGTEEEYYAALSPIPESVMQGKSITEAQGKELDRLLHKLHQQFSAMVLIVKRGAVGVSVLTKHESVDVAGFSVEVLNTVGAGDAFASGVLYGYLQGWEWQRVAQFANACGAIVVTRHGCSKAMPTLQEVVQFIDKQL